MTRQAILVCLVLLIATSAKSQNFKALYKKADYYFNLDQPTAKTDSLAIALFLQAAQLALQEGDFHSSIKSFIKAGSIRQTHQRFAEANMLYRKAIDLNREFENDTALFYQAFLYIGSSYYSSGNTDSAKMYFEKASVLSMFHPRSDHFPDQEHLYNSLGTIYFESGNYQQAKNYFEKALRLVSTSPTHPDEAAVTLQSNIANCLLQLKEHQQAISIFRQLLRSGLQTRVLTHNIAHAYYEEKKFDSALYYFNLVQRRNDIVMVRMQNDLGRIYLSRGNWKAASKALDSALMVSKIVFRETKNRDRALNYLIRSILAEKQQRYDEAVKWCNEGISEIHFNFSARNVYDVPSTHAETISPLTFLELLQQKARLLEGRYRRTNERLDLDACLQTHLAAIHTSAYIKRYFDNDEAKLYFQHDRRGIYHDALRIVHELMDDGNGNGYITALLEITEAYKGSIVYENIRHLELSTRVKLPPGVLEKERSLKQSLAFYTTRLNNAISPEESSSLRENLVSTNVELSRLLALYDNDPAYQLFKNQRLPGSNLLKNISGKLDDETAMISYNVTPDCIYILAKTANDFKTLTVHRNVFLDSIFKHFISETYAQVEGRRYTGYSAGNELYVRLLRPVLDVIGPKEKWIILPDGFLSYLPFEALCVSSDERDYLLLHHQVSYHYSFSLFLLDNKKITANAVDRRLFFAPFSTETPIVTSKGISALPFSRDETEGKNLTMMLSAEATKANWLASIEHFTTLHLATHATTGNEKDNNTQIYFYPSDSLNINNNLYVDEIYRLNLQHTGLIVLSACETAGGQSTSGEGLLSLSRAFLYAGAKGIVSSLWKTEDRVSAYLMKQMYVEILYGYSTTEALQRAKISLLQDESVSARYKTPNYWSNFVYVGSVGAGKKNAHGLWWIGAGIAALIIFGVLFIKKSYSAKQNSFDRPTQG